MGEHNIILRMQASSYCRIKYYIAGLGEGGGLLGAGEVVGEGVGEAGPKMSIIIISRNESANRSRRRMA
jgi:hypothetical protein